MTEKIQVSLSNPQTQIEWEHYYNLRWEILRKAWQQPLGSERDEFEKEAYHIMASDSAGCLLGIGRIHETKSNAAQIRYMAVKERAQRLGIGSKILKALETQATIWDVQSITLNARDTQLMFYLAHGYQAVEPGDTLYGVIKHTMMRKILSSD